MNNNFNKKNNLPPKKHIIPVKPVFLPEDFFDSEGNDVDFNFSEKNKVALDNLSKKHLVETLNNQKNIEENKFPLFSQTKPSFSPEDYFDEQGNEVLERDTHPTNFEKNSKIQKENEIEDSISCLRCVHYYVTWNKKYPRGCRKYGFETDLMPSDTILIYTCKSCAYYKNKFKKTDPNIFAEILKNANK